MDDLCTFTPPNNEKSNVADATGIPAFHEFHGANKNIQRRIGAIDVRKERGSDSVFLQRDTGVIGFHQFFEIVGVANVDETKILLCTGCP